MSGREWKPGDVAMVDGHVALVWRDDDSPRPTFVYTDSDGDPCSVWLEGNDARPLVVIDPEDRETLGKFAAWTADGDYAQWRIDWVQKFLRSLVTPPKPEVYEHLAVSDMSGTVRALCGKVWKANVRSDVTVAGQCPDCSEMARGGWVV